VVLGEHPMVKTEEHSQNCQAEASENRLFLSVLKDDSYSRSNVITCNSLGLHLIFYLSI
jgi:hypothetical protein